jgi:hypothetical protein
MLAAAHAAAAPPVVSDGLAPAIAEDTVGRITLPYRDADGDRATSCSVSSMTLTVERDCACDETGECAVEMRGLPDAHGEASFEYDVSAGGETSPRATIRLEVRPVDDPPVAITATHPPLPRDTQVVLELPYRDPDGPAQACSVSALVNVEQVGPCRCTEGRCTAAIRGLPGYEGTASLQFTISEAGRVSPPATASLAVGADAVALRIPRARDYLGFSVAAHGRRFVVGAPGEATSEPRVGSAYVLASGGPAAGAGRRLEGQLRAPEGRAGDYFGAVVAMSEGVIAVLQDGESWFPPRPNKLHLFVDPGGVGRWQRRNVIERPPGARRFGGGVGTGPGFASLAVDGARIAVGAYQAERSAGARELDGAVYVYDDPTADLDWADAVQTRLVASVPQRGAGFGLSVALDGDWLAVGAPDRDVERAGVAIVNAGAVYVFRHDGQGWREQARLEPSEPTEDANFGSTLALAGARLAVSATGGFEVGAVHVFERAGSQWVERSAALRSADGSARDAFGSGGLALAGGELYVASPFANDGAGRLSVFRDPNADGDWSDAVETSVAPEETADERAGDHFGCSFALADGALVVGAYGEDGDGAVPPNDALPGAGAYYEFVRSSSGEWVEGAYGK